MKVQPGDKVMILHDEKNQLLQHSPATYLGRCFIKSGKRYRGPREFPGEVDMRFACEGIGLLWGEECTWLPMDQYKAIASKVAMVSAASEDDIKARLQAEDALIREQPKVKHVGAITAIRLFGKAAIIDLTDGIRVFVKSTFMGIEFMENFRNDFHLGDLIEVEGYDTSSTGLKRIGVCAETLERLRSPHENWNVQVVVQPQEEVCHLSSRHAY